MPGRTPNRTEALPDLCDNARASALCANAAAAKEACFRRTECGYDKRGHDDGERKRGGRVEDEKGQYSLCPGNQMEGEQS